MSHPVASSVPRPARRFRWYEQVLPAAAFHTSLAVSLSVGFCIQVLLGAAPFFWLVLFFVGVGVAVAILRFVNLRLLAGGHSHAELQTSIGLATVLNVFVSFLTWPMLNQLRESEPFRRGTMTIAEAATSLRPGPVELQGLSVSPAEAVHATHKVRVKQGEWPTVHSWFAPLKDARGETVGWACTYEKGILSPSEPKGRAWLIVPGSPDFDGPRSSRPARDKRSPEWKDRCLQLTPPGTGDVPGFPWFTCVVLGLAELALLFSAPRNA